MNIIFNPLITTSNKTSFDNKVLYILLAIMMLLTITSVAFLDYAPRLHLTG